VKDENICKITQECKPAQEVCGNDLYFLSGYITDTMEAQLPNWKISNRRIIECETKYEENGHDLDTVVNLVRKGIQQIGNGKVDLLGFSWGGFVAQEYAQRYPDGVNKLVLINSFSKVNSDAVAALSILREIGIEPRINGDELYIKRALQYDFRENDIQVPALVYNCSLDISFAGSPPNIKGARSVTDICSHSWGRADSGGKISAMVREFLDDPS